MMIVLTRPPFPSCGLPAVTAQGSPVRGHPLASRRPGPSLPLFFSFVDIWNTRFSYVYDRRAQQQMQMQIWKNHKYRRQLLPLFPLNSHPHHPPIHLYAFLLISSHINTHTKYTFTSTRPSIHFIHVPPGSFYD